MLSALGGALWSGYLAYKARLSRRLREGSWLIVAALALQAVVGAILAVRGGRPAEPWHFVFGPLTVLTLPVALLLGRERSARVAALILFAGWLVTFGLSLRSVGTGGFVA